jgi:hypothetical protein
MYLNIIYSFLISHQFVANCFEHGTFIFSLRTCVMKIPYAERRSLGIEYFRRILEFTS